MRSGVFREMPNRSLDLAWCVRNHVWHRRARSMGYSMAVREANC